MSDHEMETLTGLANGMPRERVKQLEGRLPHYEAKDQFEDGYLKGLAMAAELLDEELPGQAATKVRELLAVAARRIGNCRPQVSKIREEVRSPEYRAWLEEESRKMLAGEIPAGDFDELLARMDDKIARAEATRNAATGRNGA
jgi:hypothetical protein